MMPSYTSLIKKPENEDVNVPMSPQANDEPAQSPAPASVAATTEVQQRALLHYSMEESTLKKGQQ